MMHANVEDVLSIFKNTGEEGRSTEEWVNQLDDRVHIMKVDASTLDNARAVKDYRVGRTPLVVIMDKGRTVLQEIVDTETFDHVKEVYQAKLAADDYGTAGYSSQPEFTTTPTASFSGSTSSNSGQSSQATIDAAVRAQRAAEEAQRAAEESLKTLRAAQIAFEDQRKIEAAKREAEDARKIAEQAQKELEEAKKLIAIHLAEDAKKEEEAKKQEEAKKKAEEEEK